MSALELISVQTWLLRLLSGLLRSLLVACSINIDTLEFAFILKIYSNSFLIK